MITVVVTEGYCLPAQKRRDQTVLVPYAPLRYKKKNSLLMVTSLSDAKTGGRLISLGTELMTA